MGGQVVPLFWPIRRTNFNDPFNVLNGSLKFVPASLFLRTGQRSGDPQPYVNQSGEVTLSLLETLIASQPVRK